MITEQASHAAGGLLLLNWLAFANIGAIHS